MTAAGGQRPLLLTVIFSTLVQPLASMAEGEGRPRGRPYAEFDIKVVRAAIQVAGLVVGIAGNHHGQAGIGAQAFAGIRQGPVHAVVDIGQRVRPEHHVIAIDGVQLGEGDEVGRHHVLKASRGGLVGARHRVGQR